MGNIPGLSGEAGGTEDVAGVTQGIGWEMFNSTDEDMEVLMPTDSYLPQGGTILLCRQKPGGQRNVNVPTARPLEPFRQPLLLRISSATTI
jgi:hypothetical protein